MPSVVLTVLIKVLNLTAMLMLVCKPVVVACVYVPPTIDACCKSVQSVAIKSEPQSVGLSVASDDVVVKSEKDVKGPAKEHAEPSSSSVTENSKKKGASFTLFQF